MCAGWLTKLGYNSGKWQARYFILTDRTLSYYSDRGGKLKGEISMPAVLSVDEVLIGIDALPEEIAVLPRGGSKAA